MKVSLNGVALEFTDRGIGAAVLLLHGFPLDRRIWNDQMEPLARTCRIVAVDLRGHGRSASTPGPYPMDLFADDALQLMSALKIPRFAVVGHSMGGYIALALHRKAPERLSGVALVASRSKADSDEAKRVREETAQRVEREGMRSMAETLPDRLLNLEAPRSVMEFVRDVITTATPMGVAASLRGMAMRPDATAQLAAIKIPTLVAAGRGDRIVPVAESEAMAAAIPGAKTAWFEKSGHMPMVEEPAAFTDALLAWTRACA